MKKDFTEAKDVINKSLFYQHNTKVVNELEDADLRVFRHATTTGYHYNSQRE